ncbi:CHAT domain-containing protein [Russula brevipes]|nr:CHAT domain-containing protein [Russula brevipes]
MPGDPTSDCPESTTQPSAGATISPELCKGEQVSQPLNEVIQRLREALTTSPYEASLALASALLTRFVFESHSTDDCEEAIAVLDDLVPSTPLGGDDADSFHARAAEMSALLTLARSIFYSDPQYSEEAMSRCRTALSSPSLDDHLRVVLTQALAIQAEQRFKSFGLTDGLMEAGSLVPDLVNLISSTEGIGGCTPADTIAGSLHQRTCLEDVACWYDTKFSRTGNLSDIEMAITYRRTLLTPPHSSHPLTFIPLGFLCDDLLIAFECTRAMGYLEESINLHRELLTMQDAQALRFTVIRRLVLSLCVRLHMLGRSEDLDEIMRLCPTAVDDRYVNVADRFKFSCLWASLARHFRHPSVSAAYESATSLMRPSLAFAPIVRMQQARLVGMGETCARMPLDYASYQIGAGRPEQAIEALERGRTLLWSELRSFRASVDQPISSHLLLAEKFAAVNGELELLTVSATLGANSEVGDDGVGGREGSQMDPFYRLVVKQRKLLKERDTLISHIRDLPGFGNFLVPPSFDTLRSAASRGPVIIINHSKWRSDILILLHDSPPSLISTPDDFYERAIRLKDRLLFARRGYGDVLGSAEHAHAVRTVLADLYVLVGRPVIDRLRQLGIPEQSRIWWCPTSVFCFLPLHAMGPIPPPPPRGDNRAPERYFCDLYIPSYTPSLSALIDARKPTASARTRAPDRPPPSLLLVAHHEDDPRGMRKEIKAVQGLRRAKAKVRVSSLTGKSATAAAVVEALRRTRFAHLAGSVKLDPGRPLDAPFRLYAGERFALLDLARCRLPEAELAFLSASHTAELAEDGIPDEALHLAAAALHCGFRGAVGAMWAMADRDGKSLCKYFYELLFAGGAGEAGTPYHERAAKALRDAVQRLRKKKGVSVDRWVTYVHYGA